MSHKRRKVYKSHPKISKRKWATFWKAFGIIAGIVIVTGLLIKVIEWLVAFMGTYYIPITVILVVAGCGVGGFFVWKHIKKKRRATPVLIEINDALKIMDSIGRHYVDEEEANRELIGILKTRGLKAEWKPPYFRWGNPDGIVDGVVLEGKLDLYKTDETDRVIGQLQRYCQSGRPVCLVLYGRADTPQIRRITDEVNTRYPHQVDIAYLNNARRRR